MMRNTDDARTLADFKIAIDLRRPVTIDYVKADGSRTVRVIEPYEPVVIKGRTLIRAMDRQSRKIRSWRLDRVYAYRVAPHRGKFKVPRPPVPEASAVVLALKPADEARWPAALPDVDLDAEWGDWLEKTFVDSAEKEDH
jgi:predicted DNA-binding transcriptional regulator YafY